MSDWLPLQLFPQGGLGSPVITTVWIGVLVLAFFNLRLGWVFIGLVVPGYLVPLLLAKPWSAVVIVVDAVLTYWVVHWLSERFSGARYWSSLFGRDRFFAFVLVSVVARVSMDGYALPILASRLEESFGLPFDFRNDLHSFGLIIVALLANQFWKPGLLTGLAQLVVTTGITFAIVRYGLMEWTNFSVGGLEYAYEDMASSILASPKAYIVLITTAFIASHLNLRYGWEYSGILIPALLALQWYQPTKLLSSLVEAWIVLAFGALLLKTPFFERRTIERASKVTLFFTVSYFYKFALGFLFVGASWKVSDAYGFGYLLPSLLAVKMHEKSIGLRMTRFTVQTTVVSASVALLVGFLLTLVALPLDGGAPNAIADQNLVTRSDSLDDLFEELRVDGYRGRLAGAYQAPRANELRLLERVARSLDRYAATEARSDLETLLWEAAQLELVVERVDDFVVLREREARRGWGFAAVRIGPPSGLILEVPRSSEEWAALPVAARLLEDLDGRALLANGAAVETSSDGSADALRRGDTPFGIFHRAFERGDVLQVRSPDLRSAESGEANRLLVKSRLPPSLDPNVLEGELGPLPIDFSRPSVANQARQTTRSGFAELHLSSAGARALIRRRARAAPVPDVYEQSLEGYLQNWLRSEKGRIAERDSEAYVPPDVEELLFFDEEILTPLLRVVRPAYGSGRLSDEGNAYLTQARRSAALLGYEVVWYRHRSSGTDYLVLLETGTPRHWGTFVLRLGQTRPFLLEVPRPLFERRTFEVGLSLFDRLEAEALLIAGSHPYANRSGSADLVLPAQKTSVFSLVNQVLLRESGAAHRLAVALRAFAQRDEDSADAMLALSGGVRDLAEAGATVVQLHELLAGDGRSIEVVDGSARTAGYEVANLPQARYLDQTRNKQYAVLWLSADVREGYRQAAEDTLLTSLLDRSGIERQPADVGRRLDRVARTPLPEETRKVLTQQIAHVLDSADVVAFEELRTDPRWRNVERLLDIESGQEFLLFGPADAVSFAVNLQGVDANEPTLVDDATSLERALAARRAVLFFGIPGEVR
ncbi:MAG: poly-gamma-glutamate biosynthesis protein PgsC/CapC [Acidobacteriota bacterium]